MAITRISDVLIPEVFMPYVIEKTKELSAFFESGIVVTDAAIEAKMANGGKTIQMPFWHDLDGNDQVTSDNPASSIVPNAVDAAEQIAVICRRAVSFGAADLAGILAGDDPMRVVAERIAPFWNRKIQTTLISTLNGVFGGAATIADSVLNVSGATAGAAVKISAGAIIDAKGTMGDAADDIRVIAVHSKVYQELQKQNLIQFIPNARGEVVIPTYMGMRVVVSDALPTGTNGTEKTYTTYLFAPGSVAYGETSAKVPVAIDRDELAADGEGVEYFVNRRHFLMHPMGYKFVGTVAGQSPTNAELGGATAWTRVFERKNVPMAALITN